MTNRLPTVFLGHGSPMTVITDNPARRAFQALGQALPRPEAILCISAHWETQGKTHLTAGERPRTIHDFRGFPPELYDMQYPAPGSAALVERAIGLLGPDRAVADETWGFDHGAWGVLQPMYPACDVPTVQLSLDRSLGAEEHFDLGAALAPLRDEGVLIVASGNVVHNLALWRQTAGTVPEWADEFRTRINRAVADGDLAGLTRFPPGRSGGSGGDQQCRALPAAALRRWRKAAGRCGEGVQRHDRRGAVDDQLPDRRCGAGGGPGVSRAFSRGAGPVFRPARPLRRRRRLHRDRPARRPDYQPIHARPGRR